MTDLELLLRLVAQLGIIWLTARLLGVAARAIGQPEVVGQMVAGLALGPSLAGHVFPGAHQWLFPASSRSAILLVAQVGLVGYMFLVGAEFRIDVLRQKARAAAFVSIAGIVVPFAVGGSTPCGRETPHHGLRPDEPRCLIRGQKQAESARQPQGNQPRQKFRPLPLVTCSSLFPATRDRRCPPIVDRAS